ncbi:copper amine oxidase N-terminal domain-containing protein [Crassaminicella indica]|uniref:Copper amine oxidase N-terminal domain-containing protein n=1 Tax=Crassaminicella indica TaxID=2855394 RepID=A0ABX8RDA2_9CLOT|nr:copper amine oxidase N-terminal domain-containing protein [Crassaminicella indica]QXM06746.1 copper amine oxidase N-terminal domain-containing protein [Crassaminicella indica]
MKKRLSLLLVLAMVLTLVPMSAFAASDNTVSNVPKVSDETVYSKVYKDDAPQLRLEEKNAGEFKDGMTFTLNVSNADWIDDMKGSDIAYAVDDSTGKKVNGKVTIDRRSDSEIDVTLADPFDRTYGTTETANKIAIIVPMLIDVDNNGAVEVEIIANDSQVSEQKLTIANAADGDTVTTINDTTDITDDGAVIETIKIEETSIGAMSHKGTQKIKLRLPSDFKWDIVTGSKKPSDDTVIELAGGFGSIKLSASEYKVDSDDDNYLIIETDKLNSTKARGKIYIKNLRVVPERDADFGEVKVKVTGDEVTSATIVIGEYQDYGVKIEADKDDDMVELFAGRRPLSEVKVVRTDADDKAINTKTDYDEDDHKLVTLKLEENADGAWITNRRTTIEFPDWVKIVDVDVDKHDGLKDIKNVMQYVDGDDRNVLEFTGGALDRTSGKIKLHLTFYVSVEAGHEGDIVAKVSGNALPNKGEVVLGKAVKPATIKAEPTNVKLGLKDQALGKIVITETKKEALADKGWVVLKLADGFEWNDEPKVEVTKGDIEIDEDSIEVGKYGDKKDSDRCLSFKIKSESTEPSEITITGGTVDLDRVLPEGDFEVQLRGDAVVQNGVESDNEKCATKVDLGDGNGEEEHEYDDLGYFETKKADAAVVARVITPADSNTKAGVEVKMQVGNSEIQVGDNVVTVDVAPYIDANGRTMLPLRALLNALGVEDQNIMWNQADTSVTVFKGDRVIKVKVGEAKYTVNGVEVPMDTVAVNKDGRVMLPVRAMANAVGAQVEWDGATRTVTIK